MAKRALQKEELKALKASKLMESASLAAASKAKMVSAMENTSSAGQLVNPYLLCKEPAE